MQRPYWKSLAIVWLAAATLHAQAPTVTVPGFDGEWVIDGRSAKTGQHLGRPAVFIRANFPPILSSSEFTDGTIEFDLAPLPGGNFLGLVFRYADGLNHENVYFRLHRSGEFEAIQYAPRVNGSGGTWQLYPQFFARAIFPADSWLRVRAEIRGSTMELFIGDSAKPVLAIPRLRGLTAKGRVGIWARVNEKPDEWAAAVATVRVRSRAPEKVAALDTTALPPGTVTGWQVAGPYPAPDTTVVPPLPPAPTWIPVAVDEAGLINVTQAIRKPAAGRFVAYLRTTLSSSTEGLVPMEIGYSDDIMIWLNGRPVFQGVNSLGSRYPGFLGLAVPSDRVFLPLRAGRNELLVALSDRIGGWGLRARLHESNVRVRR